MPVKVTINERGVITIPAALRQEMGLKANDELIVERCDAGLLLRPAFSVALEFYSEARVNDFASEEEGVAPQQAASTDSLPDRGQRHIFLDANVLFLATIRRAVLQRSCRKSIAWARSFPAIWP